MTDMEQTDMEQRAKVAHAIAAFVDMANAADGVPRGYSYHAGVPGKRFTRIVMNGGGGSVHAFVDNDTGDLLKAAGWKAPAKGPRGNILTDLEGVAERFDWSGHYLYLR